MWASWDEALSSVAARGADMHRAEGAAALQWAPLLAAAASGDTSYDLTVWEPAPAQDQGWKPTTNQASSAWGSPALEKSAHLAWHGESNGCSHLICIPLAVSEDDGLAASTIYREEVHQDAATLAWRHLGSQNTAAMLFLSSCFLHSKRTKGSLAQVRQQRQTATHPGSVQGTLRMCAQHRTSS